jgi:hypothetical protein
MSGWRVQRFVDDMCAVITVQPKERGIMSKLLILFAKHWMDWRRGWESNPRIKVLQTSPLPLGYRASKGTAFGALKCQPNAATREFYSIGWCANWSGRRDLNPRPSPWQGDALPLSYSRIGTH